MLKTIPNDLRDRIIDGVVLRLGGRDEIGRPGILIGPRDRDRKQLIHRRRTKKEREADPTLGQFQELAALDDVEINEIISSTLNEKQAIDTLIVRITEGRNVLGELSPVLQQQIRDHIDVKARSIINEMVKEAQEKKQAEKLAEQQKALAEAGLTKELLDKGVDPAIAEAVKIEHARAQAGPVPDFDPVADIVQWALDNNYKVQIDHRGKGTKYKPSWLEKMHAAREQQVQKKLADEEAARQKMMQGA